MKCFEAWSFLFLIIIFHMVPLAAAVKMSHKTVFQEPAIKKKKKGNALFVEVYIFISGDVFNQNDSFPSVFTQAVKLQCLSFGLC